ncbi:MAG: hypothetical protein KGR26_01345 [Cyanobacteria bacterium REEB65]|nr:hypothetical protein [Cyanobacteria bacterium REEB65]
MVKPQVYIPFTQIKPGVREALEATGWRWREAFVGVDDEAYWGLMSHLWERRQPFIIVEHDVIVRPDTFDELSECSESPWCAFPIPYLQGQYAGMGCVRFGAEIMNAVPDALKKVAEMKNDRHEPKHWCTVDGFLRVVLHNARMTQHEHLPALGHWRPYGKTPQPSHGCCGEPIEEEDVRADLRSGLDDLASVDRPVHLNQ